VAARHPDHRRAGRLRRRRPSPARLGRDRLPVRPDLWPINGVDLTYTGGWVERTANPDATNRLPIFIEADLAWAAYQIARPARAAAALDIPEGATSLTLGDAAVSFGPKGAVATAPAEARIKWSPRTLGYKWMRIGGDLCWY
jgi:hypothetical protein